MTTRPEGFSKLVRQNPEIFGLIQELHILLLVHPLPSMGKRMRAKVGIGSYGAEVKAWRAVFSASYAKLTTLHIVASWELIPTKLVTSFLQALKTMPCLRALDVDGHLVPLERIVQSCPSALKHFGLLGGGFLHDDPHGWSPPNPICTLGSLVLYSRLSPRWISSVFVSESPTFNLEHLKHLQTSPFRYSCAEFSTFHHIPYRTLQCIHIHLSRDPGAGVLNLTELKVLTHIELIADHLRDSARSSHGLATLLDWLEASLQTMGEMTPKVFERLSSFTISILLKNYFPDSYDAYSQSWRSLITNRNRLGWKRVDSAQVFCFFSNVLRRPTTYTLRSDPPRLIWPFDEHMGRSSYRSLWSDCSCSGWRGW